MEQGSTDLRGDVNANMLMLPMVIMTMEDEDNREYMTRLYRDYQALMLKTAWEYSQDSATVEDIVSDSCVSLIQHLNQLKAMDKPALRAYIVITVRNKALDDLRRQALRRKNFVTMDENTLDSLEETTSFERKLSLRQEMETVREAIANLPADEQDVLRMKFFRHMTDKEIAACMEIAENRVRVLIMRSRKKLKQMLYREEDGI